MGLSMPEAVGGLRLSLSADTTQADLDAVVAALPGAVDALRPAATATA
jgi:cysteine sulfinate desulfinase/cysteine desulfurase-like protein